MAAIDAAYLLVIMILLEIPVLVFTAMGFEHKIAGNTLVAILFWWFLFYILRLSARYDRRFEYHR